jgi:aconitate hydratase
MRILLESLLRNCDGVRVKEEDVLRLAGWGHKEERIHEIPFVVARVLLQDFTGVPLGVDLAAMRSALARLGGNPSLIEPLVPVDLIIDHSVQVDVSSSPLALQKNLELEFARNESRYTFLKWCQEVFEKFHVIPPGNGICHQVNLEFLAPGVVVRDGLVFPDTLVGTDSHTTMINGLGVVGWGVGGIEAEAAMLGQPVYFLTPDVVGVHLRGSLPQGSTATDLVLRITELLRKAKVVGKFIEFFGEGAASLSVPDRATISNMAPEYGATIGFFPVDERTCEYLIATGRSQAQVEVTRAYFKAQEMFGIPLEGMCDYSSLLELDLSTIVPSIAGPKRPQDRIPLTEVKSLFSSLLIQEVTNGGYQRPSLPLLSESTISRGCTQFIGALSETATPGDLSLKDGDVVIAAITSCTNTSNPSVMLAAGLLAKKAVEKGLMLPSFVKASLAPGSKVVSDYLERAGLQPYLNELGFQVVGYGCTTCIGNSGPLHPTIEKVISEQNLVVASVLSGNRNFEARVHQNVKANFLMSPPLVVAYALTGTVLRDLTTEPVATNTQGQKIFLRDIMPSQEEVAALLHTAFDPVTYKKTYDMSTLTQGPWDKIPVPQGDIYLWDKQSTYIQEPPYFTAFTKTVPPISDIFKARILAVFGDSVTTDHISPAGAIKPSSAAGKYLQERRVSIDEFNSYGARRGNHEVMVRGTFANVRIRNLLLDNVEGSMSLHQPSKVQGPLYDVAMKYQAEGVPLVVFAGQEYGTGSSRDWAAKGTKLLGVRAVIAQSFERIHRSNLIGMGVLPCEFLNQDTYISLGFAGDEEITFHNLEKSLAPRAILKLSATSKNVTREFQVRLRLDTTIEVEYYRHGGILPYVLRSML